MKTQADSIQENKSQSSSHGKFQSQGGGESTFETTWFLFSVFL